MTPGFYECGLQAGMARDFSRTEREAIKRAEKLVAEAEEALGGTRVPGADQKLIAELRREIARLKGESS